MKLKAVLIGAGKIGVSYAYDIKIAQYYKYSSHAQILHSHPNYDWIGVIDKNIHLARKTALDWNLKYFSQDLKLLKEINPDIVVLATPPHDRFNMLKEMPSLKGIIFEKPLGISYEESKKIIEFCEEKKILAQVNFWMRAENNLIKLTTELNKIIGNIIFCRCIYGNGVLNNGSHLIDFFRFLFKEPKYLIGTSPVSYSLEYPLKDDVDWNFTLQFPNNLNVAFQAIDYSKCRLFEVDLFGENGHLRIFNDGLNMSISPIKKHEILENYNQYDEINIQQIKIDPSMSMYNLYTNFYDAIFNGSELISSARGALNSFKIIDSIKNSQPVKSLIN